MNILIAYVIFTYGFNSGMFADIGADLRGVSGLLWLISPVSFPYFLYHLYFN